MSAGESEARVACVSSTGTLRLESLFLLLHTSAAEGAGHRFVALMTGVFVDLVFGLLHVQDGGPRLNPGVRIVDGHFVLQRIRTDTTEPLDHMELFAAAAPADRRVVAEVRRVDDECVP